MKKLIVLFLIFLSCSGNIATQDEIEIVEESTTTFLKETTTTSTLPEEKTMTLDDYIGEAFTPGYSPNELLFFEKDMNNVYHHNTRNKLIEEKLIDLSITQTTEYKNTVVLGDDVVCEEDEYMIEYANEEGISAEEYCNKKVTVSDWNYSRYPVFHNTVPEPFQGTPLDEVPIGQCLDSLNTEIYDFVFQYHEEFYNEVLEDKELGFKNWHRNILSGDYQVIWISPRSEQENGTIKYGESIFIHGDSTFLSGNLGPPSFFLDVIGTAPPITEEFGVISIVFDFYKSSAGSVNGRWFNETFNYDLVNCKRVYIDDIFSSKNLNAELYDGDELIPQSYPEDLLDNWTVRGEEAWLFALAYEYSKVQCLLDSDFCDGLENKNFYALPDIDFFADFALDSSGIIFYFDKYQVVCGGCNIPFPLIQHERLFRILDFTQLNN